MSTHKRTSPPGTSEEPVVAKRRSSRLSKASQTAEKPRDTAPENSATNDRSSGPLKKRKGEPTRNAQIELERESKSPKTATPARSRLPATSATPSQRDTFKPAESADAKRAGFDDPASLPDRNPDAPRHDGEWYWLMKAEPETRLENGIDVRFSIDDLRAKTEPEPWDGIRNYGARNHMRHMNLGDKAFFYHSNCKEPGIVGMMEIVKEYSEDKTALQPGTPYYDPKSSAAAPKWSLVHVAFRKKFAVPILLSEIRALSASKDSPLAEMQLVKQGRLSVNRIQEREWKYLCELADRKAEEAGLQHEE